MINCLIPRHLAVSASYVIEDDREGSMRMQMNLWLPCNHEFVAVAIYSPPDLQRKGCHSTAWLKFRNSNLARNSLRAFIFVGSFDSFPTDSVALTFNDFCSLVSPDAYQRLALGNDFHIG